jgi:CDP-diacylglycerol--glycerol-3-phosphate 3-phosphatidyltransferase
MKLQRIPKEKRGNVLRILLLTLSRGPLAVVFALLLLVPDQTLTTLVASLLVLLLIEVTDMADGFLARQLKAVTEWGAMLDPYADSVSRIVVYWGMAMTGLVLPAVPLVMAIRDVTVAYCRITLSKKGRSVAANISGKVKAWFQGVGAFLLVLGPYYWSYTGEWPRLALSWIVLVVTAASMVQYVSAAYSAAAEDWSD